MSAPLLPIFVKLEGRACLVVGAGVVGLQKVRSLLECGASVTVTAPDARDEIRELHDQGKIAWRRQRYVSDDIRGQQLAIAATNDTEVNHAVYRDATAAGVLVNAVDDPPFCDFYFGSVVRRGPLQIGISTAGESPALAQRLRRQLELLLDKGTGPWLERLGALRREVIGVHPAGEERNRLLRTLASRDVCDSAHCPSRAMALATPRENRGSWWLT
ncbi:MAG TPA: bifunctional precorrin-2 dehydrogenase/sirohydrochlorin ferrochelatase [Acidobacteriaceae bacterium]|jgi:siroheme synthase-like protein